MRNNQMNYRNATTKENVVLNNREKEYKSRERQIHPVCAGKNYVRNPKKYIRFYCFDDEIIYNY